MNKLIQIFIITIAHDKRMLLHYILTLSRQKYKDTSRRLAQFELHAAIIFSV